VTNRLISWAEVNKAPPKTLLIDQQGRIGVRLEGKDYLSCSYLNYPKWVGGQLRFGVFIHQLSPKTGYMSIFIYYLTTITPHILSGQ